MARRYFARPLPPAGPATLSPGLGHHLGRAVRTRPGDFVVLFDGAGAEVDATVIEVRGRDVLVEVGAKVARLLGRSPRLALDVACALPKSPRTDWLFEHGTEAGIRSFRPILTERTNRQHERYGHWERILIAACAQCDRSVLPTIEPTVTLDELCAMPQPQARYVATIADYRLTQEYIAPYTPQQNGLCERFIRTAKEEYVWHRRFASIEDARRGIAEWIRFYNGQRPHSRLGWMTPDAYHAKVTAPVSVAA